MSAKRLIKMLLNRKGIAVDSVDIREVDGVDSIVASVHLTKAFSLGDPSSGEGAQGYDSPPARRRWRRLDLGAIPVFSQRAFAWVFVS